MAKVTGMSGAWKEVYDWLRDEGVPVTHPRLIQPELEKLKKTYDQRVAQLEVEVINEIAVFEQQLIAFDVDTLGRIQKKRAEAETVVASYDSRLQQLQQA